jgi:hypothetical protein
MLQVHKAILRNDYPFSLMVQAAIVERLLQIVYAVNKVWYPGPKRQRERLRKLKELPDDMLQDLDGLGSRGAGVNSPQSSLGDLRHVLIKTFTWVGKNCRDIPVNPRWIEMLS